MLVLFLDKDDETFMEWLQTEASFKEKVPHTIKCE